MKTNEINTISMQTTKILEIHERILKIIKFIFFFFDNQETHQSVINPLDNFEKK